jgi:hypothetical protein
MAAFLTNGKSVLYMQRSVAHFPLAPQCVVVGRSRSGQGSVVFTFNPSTGKSVDPDMPHGTTLPYDILQTMLLSYHGKTTQIVYRTSQWHSQNDDWGAYSYIPPQVIVVLAISHWNIV